MSQRAFEEMPPPGDHVFSASARAAAADSFIHRVRSKQARARAEIARQAANDRSGRKPRGSFAVIGRDLRSPLQIVADTVVIAALAAACGRFCTFAAAGDIGGVIPTRDYIWAGLTVALLLVIIERFGDGRKGMVLTNAFGRWRDLARAWSSTFGTLLFVVFALKANTDLSRTFLVSFYLGGLVIVGLWRALAPPFLARSNHKLGYVGGDWVVVADSENAALDELIRELTSNGRSAPTVIRFRAKCDVEAWPGEQARLLAQTATFTRTAPHGAIYVCAVGVPADRLAGVGRALSILPLATYILPDAATAGLVRCNALAVGNRVAIELRRAPMNRMQCLLKRAMDIALASLALVVLSPLFLVASLAVKLDSPGPVLFRQMRRGRGGEPFRVFKFRTMNVLEDGPTIREARRGDPRVTSVGRYLRATSIDELPQLLNVLNGKMSLVGPRPHAIALDESYASSIANYEVRQHVKPGITGWAQAHGLRGETSDFEQLRRRIEFDIWYAVNASLLLDCEILVRTVFEVFRGRNAY